MHSGAAYDGLGWLFGEPRQSPVFAIGADFMAFRGMFFARCVSSIDLSARARCSPR
jgi:hypothetical protein